LKKSILILLIFSGIISAQTQFSGINSRPGTFSRMGFGARGMSMGNAMSAVREGNLVSYYNPALSVFQKGNLFQIGYSILSLDRSLNFLNYTKRFKFGKKKSNQNISAESNFAGLSIGLINSGVSNIDGRDGSGNKLGELSTSENQFFISFAKRFSGKLAFGISLKFYHYKLFEDITSSGLGLDIGALYLLNKNITVSFVLSDLNAKYKWDTSSIYGQDGNTSTDKFPLLKKIGVSYMIKNPNIIAAIEFESSNAGTNYLRGGIEYNIHTNLYLRAGLDKLNFSNFSTPVRPSLGFSYLYNHADWTLGFDYTFVYEPYSLFNDQHVLGLTFNFN